MKDKFKVEAGEELPPVSKLVTLETGQIYSGWPEIRNLHTDEAVARALGLPAVLMQGQLGTAYLSEFCLSFFGEKWFQGGKLFVRYLRPVLVPQKLTVKGRVRQKVRELDKERFVLEVWLENEKGEKVQAGEASALV